MSDKIELMACPFCGSAPNLEDHRTIWAVRCSCGACVLGERAQEPETEMPAMYWERFERTAVDAWNRRAALTQQPAPAVPEGWRLVPVEPTQEMVDAHSAGTHRVLPAYVGAKEKADARIVERYRAMLAAAPAAPVAAQETVATVRSNEIFDTRPGEGFSREDWRRLQALPVGTKLYAAPPAAEQPECSACRQLSIEITALRAGREFCGACPDSCYRCEVEGSSPDVAAEQPYAVKVPREMLQELRAFTLENDSGRAGVLRGNIDALLAGGEA